FNAKTFWNFLKTLRQRASHSRNKSLITLDNAKYHHARLRADWREECRSTFWLSFVPAYSPKLNVMERVWKLTRRLSTHNISFEDTEQIPHAEESQFEMWSNPNETLRRLCAIN